MTAYKDFIIDFPNRCERILTEFSKEACDKDVEVTLFLSAFLSAFILSFEKLRDPIPGTNYSSKYVSRKEKLEIFENMMLSELNSGREWKIIDEVVPNSDGEIDIGVFEVCGRPIPETEIIKKIEYILRHALAHGGVFTLHSGNEIEKIVFISERGQGSRKYIVLISSLENLKEFFFEWVGFVNQVEKKNQIRESR